MKLRFNVEQAESRRRGIDPKSVVTVQVDPSKLTQAHLNLIADRLVGIDVCQLHNSDQGTVKLLDYANKERKRMGTATMPVRIVAKEPTFAGLMRAIKEDQRVADERRERHRNVALCVAAQGIDTVSLVSKANGRPFNQNQKNK